jgi:hypothetical protein
MHVSERALFIILYDKITIKHKFFGNKKKINLK